MFETTTLVVVVQARDRAAAVEDIVKGVRWACRQTPAVVIVDPTGQVEMAVDETTHTLHVPSAVPENAPYGFHHGYGLQVAVDRLIKFKYAMLLDDRMMVTGRFLDEWALKHMTKEGLGAVGVIDRRDVEPLYRLAIPKFVEWGLPHERWERPPMFVDHRALFLPEMAVRLLHQEHILVPPGLAEWPTTAQALYGWAVQMWGLRCVGWGLLDQQLPPLFVAEKELPAPMLLAAQFMLFGPGSEVPHYSEDYLREAYRKVRGESTRELPVFRPIVSPDPA